MNGIELTKNEVFTAPRDGANESLWQSKLHAGTESPSFNESTIYDTLIVGGGITGLTAAVLLQQQGQKCLLVDAHNLGYGTTGGTTAHINTFADTTYAEVENDFGAEAAQQFADDIAGAVSTIQDWVQTYKIDCDFERKQGFVYADEEKQLKELDSLFQSAVKVGVKARLAPEAPVPIPTVKVITIDDQAQFHPLKYLMGLREVFVKAGGVILENTRIEQTTQKDGYHEAESESRILKAKQIIYATHIPPGGVNPLHFEAAPYRSYVLAVTLKDKAYPDALVYDMQDPYHYFRSHVIEGQKYLVVGGADHKTGHGDPEASFAELEAYVRQYYEVDSVAYRWSAQYYMPVDGLPYIGKLPGFSEGIFTGTGYNGNGMILGTLAGKILSDLVLGKENPSAALYDPGRVKPLAAASEFIKENADVAYRFVADRFSTEELDSLDQLQNDSGMVAEFSGQKVAIYKDPSGDIHAVSPVCTHTHCIVNWNNSEKSWDCPCHGARFDTDGTVLTGPARRNLEPIELKGKA
ncbi:FAD-dependent oxidoreductase [Siphonobacter curvatus]|uniref:Oxidoreductase n=1 Tax=Siphonobacter curvatus TaxID=2094562 RepID=A0A2S7IHB0_9BACT|nr:FAD-dependent oxidoreductase [Siphonobacter curvatus]PQA55093.1 oxidoreductase [Siphonobacter curvatus]